MEQKRIQIAVGDRGAYLDELGEVQLLRLKGVIEIRLKHIKLLRDIEEMKCKNESDTERMEWFTDLLTGEIGDEEPFPPFPED